MNAAQARPTQNPMLALLDEPHYVFFCNYAERPNWFGLVTAAVGSFDLYKLLQFIF